MTLNLTPPSSKAFNLTPSSPKTLEADAVLGSLVPREQNSHLVRGHLQIIPPRLVLEHYLERGERKLRFLCVTMNVASHEKTAAVRIKRTKKQKIASYSRNSRTEIVNSATSN